MEQWQQFHVMIRQPVPSRNAILLNRDITGSAKYPPEKQTS